MKLRYSINLLKYSLGFTGAASLYYIAPNVNWSLDWDGYYITRNLKKKHGLNSSVQSSISNLFGQLIHFGSISETIPFLDAPNLKYNQLISTVFHGNKDNPKFTQEIENLLGSQQMFYRFVTSCKIMTNRLKGWGFREEKIAEIPLGVDLQKFHPIDDSEKRQRRQDLGIPDRAFVIGSFHKDGVGMKDGLQPKMIKGPDVFLKTISLLKETLPVYVYLTAPARGYVISGLEKLGIPYKHDVFSDYREIPGSYGALDAYLVPSREEGGPKGVLEAMASGIPVVSTRVGLAPDVIHHGQNGLLADVEDFETLAANVTSLYAKPELKQTVTEKGLNTIQAYDWDLIADRYYNEIYSRLL